MAESSSPDWLPAGWTVESKVLKTGRQIRYYTNSVTGQKFYTKDDLIQYTKMGRGLQNMPQTPNKCSESVLENKYMQLVVQTNECPEWLPGGWTMEVKTRKSGSSSGRQFKVYCDPSTGCKFYSKPEVFRYLKAVGCKSSPSKQKKRSINMSSASKVVVQRSTDHDLPPGWIKELKIRKNACGDRKDPYYTDPVSGYVFRSRRDVLRYIETGHISRHAFLPKKRHINEPRLTNIETSPSTAAKRLKLKHPTTKRLLFADDASNCTSSIPCPKAVGLKQGEDMMVSAEDGLAASPTVKVQKHSKDSAVERGFETKENSITLPKAEDSTRNQCISVAVDKRLLSPSTNIIFPEKNLQENGMEKISGIKTQKIWDKPKKKKEHNLPRRTSKRLSGLEPEFVAEEVSTRTALPNTSRKDEVTQEHKSDHEMELACDASADVNSLSNEHKLLLEDPAIPKEQPLVRPHQTIDDKSDPPVFLPFGDSSLDPCLEFAFKTLTGAITVEDIADKGPISSSVVNIQQGKKLGESRMEESSTTRAQITSWKIKNQPNVPRRSSKRLAGFEPELVSNSTSGEKSLGIASRKSSSSEDNLSVRLTSDGIEDRASEQHVAKLVTGLLHNDSADVNATSQVESSNKGKEFLEVQNNPREKPQELENGKTSNEQTESQLFFPFGDSWSDPCLEFAIKTLTGAIPLEENSVIQDYFQQQFETSTRTRKNDNLGLQDFGFPSFFQSDISSHFDGPEKQPATQQQLPLNPSCLHPANVSLPSCSAVGSQQCSLETTKEIHGRVKS